MPEYFDEIAKKMLECGPREDLRWELFDALNDADCMLQGKLNESPAAIAAIIQAWKLANPGKEPLV